jgi:hypothetical protein
MYHELHELIRVVNGLKHHESRRVRARDATKVERLEIEIVEQLLSSITLLRSELRGYQWRPGISRHSGIVIPFPQRDLHVKSVTAPLVSSASFPDRETMPTRSDGPHEAVRQVGR